MTGGLRANLTLTKS